MSSQEQLSMLTSGKLISISQAATLTPYSAEYLSLLARKGRLNAIKISRDWLTTEEAVKNYVAKQVKKHEKMLKMLEGGKI
ncbi:MAG: helix-turn-helix domain-containing protein [Patescibacteria group bacterium]|nr:helix-turn-helix domain-containing protein [Patescibacteria group bacterium]